MPEPQGGQIFVGRQDLLERFDQLVRDEDGLVVLVRGQQGMGKTWLLQAMEQRLVTYTDIQCRPIYSDISSDLTTETMLQEILELAIQAAGCEGFVAPTQRRRKQMNDLIKSIFGDRGEAVVDFIKSFRRDPARNLREQFLEQLLYISHKLPPNGRVVYFFDPVTTMRPGSDDSWVLLLKSLPKKIKFVFAQRPEDVLLNSSKFRELIGSGKCHVVPSDTANLPPLSSLEIEELLTARSSETGVEINALKLILSKYHGHPYALQAAIDLLKAGTDPNDLPLDPSPAKIADAQWRKVLQWGRESTILFQSYAILGSAVADAVIYGVSGIDAVDRQRILADPYVGALIDKQGEERRIYHSLLAVHICSACPQEELRVYHNRAINVYRLRLKESNGQDYIAAQRIPYHSKAVGGQDAFVHSLINDSCEPLRILGQLEQLHAMLDEALAGATTRTSERATLLRYLGLVYRTQRSLDDSLALFQEALEISRALNDLSGMERAYRQIGLVYRTKGDATSMAAAEEIFIKVLEICRECLDPSDEARAHNDLGLVFRTRGSFAEAEREFEEAECAYRELGSDIGVARAKANLGILYRIGGRLEDAEVLLQDALALNVGQMNQEGIAKAKVDLAVVYKLWAEKRRGEEKEAHFERAQVMYKEALAVYERIPSIEGLALARQGLGDIYLLRGDYSNAQDQFQESLSLFAKFGRTDRVASVKCQLGRSFRLQGDYISAEQNVADALLLLDKHDYKEGRAIAHKEMGIICSRAGKREDAVSHWQKSEALYRELGMWEKACELRNRLKKL